MGATPGQKHNRKQRREREQRMAHLATLFKKHGRNWTQEQYAEAVGVKRPTVTLYLKELEISWQESARIDTDAAIRKQLEHIEWAIAELKAEWQRSKHDARDTDVIGKPIGDGDSEKMKPTMIKRKIRGKTGDAAYVSALNRLLERQASLLGLDAPKRTEVSGADGGELVLRVIRDDGGDKTGN